MIAFVIIFNLDHLDNPVDLSRNNLNQFHVEGGENHHIQGISIMQTILILMIFFNKHIVFFKN